MRVVTRDYEVLVLVIEQAFRTTFEVKLRQRFGFTLQQRLDLFEVVGVDVYIAPSPNELTDFQVALLSQHVRQQRITGDVER